jgi:hypothetical protein
LRQRASIRRPAAAGERVSTLSRFHPSLPQPQTTGRLQGDTSLGRLILHDMPERNLLLEAYATRK